MAAVSSGGGKRAAPGASGVSRDRCPDRHHSKRSRPIEISYIGRDAPRTAPRAARERRVEPERAGRAGPDGRAPELARQLRARVRDAGPAEIGAVDHLDRDVLKVYRLRRRDEEVERGAAPEPSAHPYETTEAAWTAAGWPVDAAPAAPPGSAGVVTSVVLSQPAAAIAATATRAARPSDASKYRAGMGRFLQSRG
jgi:hypothetical protein